MLMKPRLRKFALTAHVIFSVGWLGAVIAYLPLAVTSVTNQDAETVRAAYASMQMVGWVAIVPLSLAALLTGLIQSLGTEWGLFRYYWVVAKFVLTIGATTVLLLHMPTVSRMARGTAATMVPTIHGGSSLQLVVHATGGLLVLLTATGLSIYKPWGKTSIGSA